MTAPEGPRHSQLPRRAKIALGIGVFLYGIAMLVTLATYGIYIDALRPLWVPFPPDWAKELIGVVALIGSIIYAMEEWAKGADGEIA